eukprot:scaffold1558_cov403-Prasinococcus_capsulatus_cf.AAC.13
MSSTRPSRAAGSWQGSVMVRLLLSVLLIGPGSARRGGDGRRGSVPTPARQPVAHKRTEAEQRAVDAYIDTYRFASLAANDGVWLNTGLTGMALEQALLWGRVRPRRRSGQQLL